MRISRLQLRNVRRHTDLDLTFAPGLTVVRGPNESGKSTIQRALELALTRRVTSGHADLDGLRSWNAADDDRPWVRLEFEQEDLDGVRAGTLEKAFRGARGTVKLELDGDTITDPARADEVLGDLTGIPSEPFFRSTASVRHHELDGLARDEAALRDRLQASISGADRGTSRARRKLEKALYELNTKGDKNPGRIKAAEANLATSTAAQRNGEVALSLLEKDRDSLAQAREDRAVAEAALAEQRSLLEKARLAERLIAEREQARERFERYSTAVDVSKQIEQLEASHPSPNGLPALREAMSKVRASDLRIREIKAALAGEVPIEFDAVEPTPRSWRPTAIVAIVFIVLAVVIAAADRLSLLPHELRTIGISALGQTLSLPGAPVLAGLLVLFGIGLAMVGRRQRIRAQTVRKTRDLRTQEIERRLRGRSMLEQEQQMEEVTLSNLLAALELPNLPAVEALVAAEEAHMTSILKLRAQLEGLVGREPTQTLPELRDRSALDIEQKTGALEALGPIAHEARARERLEVAVADADRVVGVARDDEAQARARVEQNTVDAEEVAGHAERAAIWAEQLTALQRRARVYDATLKALDNAERATIRTATRYLERTMVGDLDRVTAGRYRRVRVDDENLGLRVYAPERGDWVDVTTLSQGTLDAVYLAARIGLVRLVTGDRRPPLILDDPFVTLDDARAARALELLHDISTDFQVIYLTTSDRYDATADAVVELPPATALSPETIPDDLAGDAPADEQVAAEALEAAPGAAAAAPAAAPVAGARRGGGARRDRADRARQVADRADPAAPGVPERIPARAAAARVGERLADEVVDLVLQPERHRPHGEQVRRRDPRQLRPSLLDRLVDAVCALQLETKGVPVGVGHAQCLRTGLGAGHEPAAEDDDQDTEPHRDGDRDPEEPAPGLEQDVGVAGGVEHEGEREQPQQDDEQHAEPGPAPGHCVRVLAEEAGGLRLAAQVRLERGVELRALAGLQLGPAQHAAHGLCPDRLREQAFGRAQRSAPRLQRVGVDQG